MVAAFFILCSFPSFQGFAKTWIVSNLNSKLAQLGEQIDRVQKTISEMQGQLSAHQNQIDEHQKELDAVQSKIRKTQAEVLYSQTEITNQLHQIFALQDQLASAQTNLNAQQQKLADVEYLVNNLFSKTTNENIPGNDTNRVCHISTHGTVFFKLESVPVHNSVHVVELKAGTGNSPLVLNQIQIMNIISFSFAGSWDTDWKDATFYIEYVKDTRQTNIIQNIETTTNELILDHSLRIPFN